MVGKEEAMNTFQDINRAYRYMSAAERLACLMVNYWATRKKDRTWKGMSRERSGSIIDRTNEKRISLVEKSKTLMLMAGKDGRP